MITTKITLIAEESIKMVASFKKWVGEKRQEWVCRDAQEIKNEGEDGFYEAVEEDVGYQNQWSPSYPDGYTG